MHVTASVGTTPNEMMIGEQVHSSSGPDSISNHNFSINASNHGGQSQTQSLGRSQGQTVRKRPKASQACASCRKHKTRCELIDSDEPKVDGGNDKDQSSSTSSPAPYARRCHRCTILRLPCSFESGERSLLLLVTSPPTSHVTLPSRSFTGQ